jgi:diguanylate cyclase (GGDEF)-like protein
MLSIVALKYSMSNNKNLIKLLSPSDTFPIALVIIGILISIFIDVTALRLIGAGVAIIGIISFVMVISRRMGEVIDSRFKPKTPTPNFKVTVKKDSSATRKTIEGFKEEIEKEEKNQENSKTILENKTDKVKIEQSSDDGFRIVGKIKSSEKIKNENIAKESNQSDFKISVRLKEKEEAEEKVKSEVKSEVETEMFEEENTLDSKTETFPESSEKEAQYVSKKIDLTLDHLMEESPPEGDEPRHEFEYCLSRILLAMRSVSNTKTASFLLFNHRTNEIKLDAYVTDSPELINSKMKFSLSSDIISQILINAKPEILTEINPNAVEELLPYYNSPPEIQSFIGVPVFYKGDTIGIICADSLDLDAYERGTVNFLAHFTQLVATLLGSYIEKYDLKQSAQTLDAITNFSNIASSPELDLGMIQKALRETAYSISEAMVAGTVSWDFASGGWKVCGVISEDVKLSDLVGKKIDESSLIAHAINEKESMFLSGLGEFESLINTDENLSEFSHCLVIPIIYSHISFGVLFVLSRASNEISSDDIEILSRLCSSAAESSDRLNMLRILQAGAVYDIDTGLLNSTGFSIRLDEEMDKARDLEIPFCLVLISIDHYESLQSDVYDERKRLINYQIEQIVNRMKRSFDIFAASEGDSYAVILTGFDEQRAKVWSEKVRNEVAVSQIEFGGKQFNITISASVVSSNLAQTSSELYSYGREALLSAVSESNSVVVFT